MTFTVSSSDTTIATASVSGSVVTVTPVAIGSATITVTAQDPDGSSVNQTIAVTVVDLGPTTNLLGIAGQCGLRAINTQFTIFPDTNEIDIIWVNSELFSAVTVTLDDGQSQPYDLFVITTPTVTTTFNILSDSAGLVKFAIAFTAASGLSPCEETLQLTLPIYVDLGPTPTILDTAGQCGTTRINTQFTIFPDSNRIEILWIATPPSVVSAITVTLDDGQSQPYATPVDDRTTTFNILSDSAGLVKLRLHLRPRVV